MAENNVPVQDMNEILRVRREKLANLCNDGKNPYEKTVYDFDAYAGDIKENFEKFDGKNVSIAGRIMSRRVMGKASFYNVQDSTCGIQLYIRREDVGEETYAAFKKYDIGDIVGVKGFVFRTQTGEISHTGNRAAL